MTALIGFLKWCKASLADTIGNTTYPIRHQSSLKSNMAMPIHRIVDETSASSCCIDIQPTQVILELKESQVNSDSHVPKIDACIAGTYLFISWLWFAGTV